MLGPPGRLSTRLNGINSITRVLGGLPTPTMSAHRTIANINSVLLEVDSAFTLDLCRQVVVSNCTRFSSATLTKYFGWRFSAVLCSDAYPYSSVLVSFQLNSLKTSAGTVRLAPWVSELICPLYHPLRR
jgi:hypothetical protein